MTDQTAEACRWMRVEKGLSNQEIAGRMNMTPWAVANALRRAGVLPPRKRSGIHASGPGSRTGEVPNPILIDQRDPCCRCGVRADVHDELGCARWCML
jgi:hypothetical protein